MSKNIKDREVANNKSAITLKKCLERAELNGWDIDWLKQKTQKTQEAIEAELNGWDLSQVKQLTQNTVEALELLEIEKGITYYYRSSYLLGYDNEDKSLMIYSLDIDLECVSCITNISEEEIYDCLDFVCALQAYGNVYGDYQELRKLLIMSSFDFIDFKFVRDFDYVKVDEIVKVMDEKGISDVLTIDEDFNLHLRNVDCIVTEIVEQFKSVKEPFTNKTRVTLSDKNGSHDNLWHLILKLYMSTRLELYKRVYGDRIIEFNSDRGFQEALSKTILKDWTIYYIHNERSLILQEHPREDFRMMMS